MSGWGALGDVLGGGFNTDNAYESGRLRTAQTEVALETARNKQLENMANEFKAKNQTGLEDAMIATGQYTPEMAKMIATASNAGVGTDFNAMQSGIQTGIENKALGTLGNPNAPLGDQFSAGQVTEHKFVPRLANTGGAIMDVTQYQPGVAPTIYNTPEAESKIAENRAQAQAALDPTLHAGAANAAADPYGGKYGKPLPGQYPNPAFDEMQPVSDTNSPFVMRPDVPQGVNQAVQQGRVLEAAAFVTNGIMDFAAMPIGASAGMWGSGDAPGKDTTIMTALASQAKYEASPAAINQFNAMIPTMNTALLTLETQGVRGAAKLADSFNPMAFRKGDGLPRNIGTLMYKAALYRQRVETGLLPLLTQPSTPAAVKAVGQHLVDQVRQAIPFTTVQSLQWQNNQGKNPRATIGDTLTKAYLNKPVGAQAPGSTSPSGLRTFASEEEARAAGFQNGQRVNIGGVDGTLN